MPSRRLYCDPLAIFLAVVSGILIGCLLDRMAEPSFDQALVLLREGDLERDERKRLQRMVMDVAEEGPADRRLPGAMAGVCLGDEGSYRALTVGQRQPPIGPEDHDMLPAAALGEPCLERLLHGWLEESRGKKAEARAAYEQAAASAGRFCMPLAATLAKAGLERLR